jgi:hypothetical protein
MYTGPYYGSNWLKMPSICEAVYGIGGKVHLWSYVIWVLSINIAELTNSMELSPS